MSAGPNGPILFLYTLHWTQMADGHLGWSQKSTLVYTLNLELMCRFIVTDGLILMYRFAKVTIYLRFAFIITVFDIFKLIIDYQVDH